MRFFSRKLNWTFVLTSCFSLYCVTVIGYNIADYDKFIKAMANGQYENDFSENLQKILKIEPNYFDYSPFKGPGRIPDFECEDTDPDNKEATSVHRLRPKDIKVVAALGDSLTAALGSNAKTILGLLFEFRGRSWSQGGDLSLEKLVTLPNIIKTFNPNLKGYSKGIDLLFLNKEGTGLNVAVSGAEANNIPKQMETLVTRMKLSNKIDYLNDWKLITLFIGGNDLCDLCKDNILHSPQSYIDYIQESLDFLYKEVPRTFVNLVGVLNVKEVKNLNIGLVCSVIHNFVCPCAAYPNNIQQENQLNIFFKLYTNFTENLASRYNGRDDFTVVYQPFFRDFEPPRLQTGEIDLSYFAPDCFHLSTKGHAAAAIGLWNNMLQPVGNKSTAWKPNDKILCPTKKNPYIFTYINSEPDFDPTKNYFEDHWTDWNFPSDRKKK